MEKPSGRRGGTTAHDRIDAIHRRNKRDPALK
jgi:hypothetical protein